MMSAYSIPLPNCSKQLENLLVPLYHYPRGKEAFSVSVLHEVFDFTLWSSKFSQENKWPLQ